MCATSSGCVIQKKPKYRTLPFRLDPFGAALTAVAVAVAAALPRYVYFIPFCYARFLWKYNPRWLAPAEETSVSTEPLSRQVSRYISDLSVAVLCPARRVLDNTSAV